MHVERESDIFRKIKKEEEEREREKKKKTNSRLGVICLYIIHVGSDVYMRASTLCCFHSHSTETVPKFYGVFVQSETFGGDFGKQMHGDTESPFPWPNLSRESLEEGCGKAKLGVCWHSSNG